MAKAKKEVRRNQPVQGRSLTIDDLQARLGTGRSEAMQFISDNNISFIRVGEATIVDEADVERALNGSGKVSPSRRLTNLRTAAERLVRRSREKQGLPPKIQDPEVIARIVALIDPTRDE